MTSNIIGRLKNFPVWFARCRHCRGFGVQSPWAYAFIRYVIGEKWPYYAYKRLDKHSQELSWKEKKQYRLFFRIANYCRSACIMDFSACNDICGMYIKAGSVNSKIMKIMPDKTPEEYAEAIDKAGTPGFVLMSFTGNWRSFFKELAAHADNKTLAVVTGINRDCNSRRCWKEIVSSKKSIITFDLYYCGIVFFDKKRYKQHYIVNF